MIKLWLTDFYKKEETIDEAKNNDPLKFLTYYFDNEFCVKGGKQKPEEENHIVYVKSQIDAIFMGHTKSIADNYRENTPLTLL